MFFFFIHYECESPLMASAQFISLIYNSRPFASFPRDAVCRTHTQNTPLNMAADCTMYCAYNAPQGIVLLSPQFPNNG